MDFYSPEFFAFSLAVLALFFVVPARLRWVVLLAASYSFYAAFKAAYLGILVFCTLAAYGGALAMNRCEARQTRRLMLIAGLVCQLGILGIFKYVSFLDASLGQLLGWGGMAYSGTALSLIVPVGISFYVFQNVSYLVDVYRRDVPAERHPGIFAAYVAFFPKLLSGPIERASQFLPQLSEHSRFDAERFTNGLKLVCWGLFKKLVIAERLAAFVNVVYADPQAYSGVSLALACVFYSFQIYCDFSGYTDIAIGLGQMFGLRLTDNFNRPYSATSISDFWRRWHISLSSWLRDYLYIPLGGNRAGVLRHYLNYLVVFGLCGLWHGASWTFVAWGLLHGFYLVCGRITAKPRAALAAAVGLDRKPALARCLKILITFILVTLAWIFFRAESLSQAFYILGHLFSGWENLFAAEALGPMLLLTKSRTDLILAVLSLVFLGVVHALERHENMRRLFAGRPLWARFAFYYVLVAGILLLSPPNAANFIYFQF